MELIFDKGLGLMSFDVQAEDQFLHLSTLQLMAQDLMQQWAIVCGYIVSTCLRQEIQNVKGHVSIILHGDF